MLKKSDAVFDKGGESVKAKPPAPPSPKRSAVPTILQHEIKEGWSWVLVTAKSKSGLKLTRFRRFPIPNGKWFRAPKEVVQYLMGQRVNNNVLILPVGMHPKDIGIEE